MDKQGPHCQLTLRWRRIGQELVFSWPLSIPFAILRVDLWMPKKYPDSKGNMALMNAICDMSQFVAIVSVPDDSSATLADYFFQHILMKFGLCHLVVLDNSTPFLLFLLCVKRLNLTMIYLPSVIIRDYQWNTSTAS